MDAILFFNCFFSVDNYKSIKCNNTQEVENYLRSNKNIKFLITPEEKNDLINFPENTERPIVVCITKNYKGYENGKFNQILMTEKTAKMMIEQWLS